MLRIISALVFAGWSLLVHWRMRKDIRQFAESIGATDLRGSPFFPSVRGRWRGYEARWLYRGGGKWYTTEVRLGIPAPMRVRIRRRSLARPVLFGGPHRIDTPEWPDLIVNADDSTFARRLLADRELETLIALTFEDAQNVLEIGTKRIRATIMTRHSGDRVGALTHAWELATAVAKRLV
jgi:hypothetical protein